MCCQVQKMHWSWERKKRVKKKKEKAENSWASRKRDGRTSEGGDRSGLGALEGTLGKGREMKQRKDKGLGGEWGGLVRSPRGFTHHTCSLIFFPSISTVRILKSIPRVESVHWSYHTYVWACKSAWWEGQARSSGRARTSAGETLGKRSCWEAKCKTQRIF